MEERLAVAHVAIDELPRLLRDLREARAEAGRRVVAAVGRLARPLHDGVRLELVPLACDEQGIIYTPLREGRAFWPENTFGEDVAELDERRIRVISLAALKAEKSEIFNDPNVEAKNAADLATLDRIG